MAELFTDREIPELRLLQGLISNDDLDVLQKEGVEGAKKLMGKKDIVEKARTILRKVVEAHSRVHPVDGHTSNDFGDTGYESLPYDKSSPFHPDNIPEAMRW